MLLQTSMNEIQIDMLKEARKELCDCQEICITMPGLYKEEIKMLTDVIQKVEKLIGIKD